MLSDLERDKGRYAQADRLKGLLTGVSEELPDAPLYFNHHDLCRTVKCNPFKAEVLRSAILNAGAWGVATQHVPARPPARYSLPSQPLALSASAALCTLSLHSSPPLTSATHEPNNPPKKRAQATACRAPTPTRWR